MELSNRQEKIVEIVKANGPITGEKIGEHLSLTRATLRPDLAILTMAGFLEARPRVGYFYTGKSHSELLTDKIEHMFIKDYQSVPVVLKEDSSVYNAISTMFLEDIGTLFVVDNNGLLSGVLSRKDLLRASIGQKDLNSIPVHIIMTRMPNIVMCKKDDLLIHVAREMIDKGIDGLPVVKERDNGYEVIGRVTKTTITNAFLELVSNRQFQV
ncbi:MAG TPA: helix-turn-helix transcriptional regulator [Candidatus Avamphibacillus intestinigallinarum]|nr:helix-turn-helix transcriptional regulator [Candidatus Avamphibacillus intestinigallinarum]